MKLYAVIGANYGDEGKGLMVDYLARRYEADLVVRFNGGAQAGHTVCVLGGPRHVFSHFGAGTFAGAATYLGPEFIVNPVLFLQELTRLPGNRCPKVYVHADCRVTVPSDMLRNQSRERGRAKSGKQHGSCGVGIYETIERSRTKPFLVTHNAPPEAVRASIPHGMRERFEDDYDTFRRMVEIVDDLPKAKVVVFEGAQGLGLSMENTNDMPFLTPSLPGIANIKKILAGRKVSDPVEVVYVTRTWVTRHGPGPLKHERDVDMPDPTNITNEWQGRFRHGVLDVEEVAGRIRQDFQGAPKDWELSLAITHCDHPRRASNGFPVDTELTAYLAPYRLYCGYGPTAGKVTS